MVACRRDLTRAGEFVTRQGESKATTSQFRSRWTDCGGMRLHARVSDRRRGGLPAVLVHGIGVSSRYMLPLGEKLVSRCRVYALDLPGFGKSAKPRRILTPAELADALASWLEAEGLSDVVLVANSFGCQVVVDCVARHPERIQRVVLAGPTIDASARTVAAQLFRWLQNGRYEPLGLAGVVLRDYLDCGMRRVFRTFALALEDRIEDKLPHVRVPALVVRGARDRIVPQEWAGEVARLLPRGRLETIPEAAHTINYGAAGQLAVLVWQFMCEAPPPRGG